MKTREVELFLVTETAGAAIMAATWFMNMRSVAYVLVIVLVGVGVWFLATRLMRSDKT
jgi:hypothetical protein